MFIAVIFLSSCSALNSTKKADAVHYIPLDFEVTYAPNVAPSDKMKRLIQKKLYEYTNDAGWFYPGSTPVSLAILITNVETASKAASVALGPVAPTPEISGEVVMFSGDNPIHDFKVSATYRTVAIDALFADLDDRLAGQFAAKLMEKVRQ